MGDATSGPASCVLARRAAERAASRAGHTGKPRSADDEIGGPNPATTTAGSNDSDGGCMVAASPDGLTATIQTLIAVVGAITVRRRLAKR